MTGSRLQFFGEVCLLHGDARIAHFGTTRAAKLLVLLGLSPTGQMLRSRIAADLWPDDYYEATRLRLRQEIHRLKRALGDASGLIGSDQRAVWLDRSSLTTDLDQLRSSADVEYPDRFLQEFLPGWDDPWVLTERALAKEARLAKAVRVCEWRLETGDADGAYRLAKTLLDEDPQRASLATILQRAREQLQMSGGPRPAQREESQPRAKEPSPAETSRPADWAATIPIPIDPILGRDSLAESVLKKLAHPASRLLTLVGPGGIGKTRLAMEVASRIRGRRVGFVSLADLGSPHDWPLAVLSQLRETPPTGADPFGFLCVALSGVPSTLVLDNLDTALPEAAEGLRALLEQAADLQILATSVRPSEVPGERLVPVGPLDPPTSGVELLRQSLEESRPQLLERPDANARLLEISEKLDGYPLAIRLAAGRLRMLSPEALLAQIHDSLASAPRGELAERHRSLDAALDSTFRALSESQRTMIERVAAYPGGLSMELAELEFEGEPYLDQIESLLDLSLLTLGDGLRSGWIEMLWPVRNYTRRSMSVDAQAQADGQAARSILAFVSQRRLRPWSPLTLDDLARLDPEYENVAFAVSWAWEHERSMVIPALPGVLRYELARGRGSARLAQIEELGRSGALDDTATAAELELCSVAIHFAHYREQEGLRNLQRASQLASQVADPGLTARVAFAWAQYSYRKDLAHALERSLEALRLAEIADDRYLIGRICRSLALISITNLDESAGRKYLRRSYEALTSVGSVIEAAISGCHLAYLVFHAEMQEEAASLMTEARSMVEQASDQGALAYLREIEGRLAIEEGRSSEAEVCFRDSLRLWRAIGSAFQMADQYHSLTRALMLQDKWSEAGVALNKAAECWRLDDNKGGFCATLMLAGQTAYRMGEADRARQIYALASKFEKQHGLKVYHRELAKSRAVLEDLGEVGTIDVPATFEGASPLIEQFL